MVSIQVPYTHSTIITAASNRNWTGAFYKRVYTSLLAGILAGALLYANGNLELMLNTMLLREDGGMVASCLTPEMLEF